MGEESRITEGITDETAQLHLKERYATQELQRFALCEPKKRKVNDMSERAKVTEFEVLDHGVDHAQYFPGCGTAFTDWELCVTGCGQSAAEAFDDALEQIAMDGLDVTGIERSEDGKLFASEKAHKATVHKDGEECPDDCELYYYVSIRFNTSTKPPSTPALARKGGSNERDTD